MRFYYLIIFTFLCCNTMFSQRITVDDTVDLTTLIEDNFVDGCVNISNINSPVNGNGSGFPSYAYFARGSSNFPFSHGIMLSTGRAKSGGNSTITPELSEGSTVWGTDPDLEAALGTNNAHLNATAIEFDFVSISNQFKFNYLLASEEYFDTFPCFYSDGFVFLIKEADTNTPYENIALLPGSTTAVNTQTIRPKITENCLAQNEQYFKGYNVGDTNYNGRTTVLTASGTIKPNVKYRIKLIIADQSNGGFDSAVFIEGDSFRVLDLGPDISTCETSATLNANIQNPAAKYEWYLNNNRIPGASSATYNATQNGTYRVYVSVPVNGSICTEQDEIDIILNSEEPMNSLSDYMLCEVPGGNGKREFDLSTKDSQVASQSPFTNYDFSYHLSDTDARNNRNPITSPITNSSPSQPIYVRVFDLDGNCYAYSSFNIVVNPIPNINPPTTLEVCDRDDSPDGYSVINLELKNHEITGQNPNLFVSYHYNYAQAEAGNTSIPIPYINSSTPNETVYVRVRDINTNCVAITTLDIHVEISPIVNLDPQYIDACDTDLDGHASFNLTEVLPNILNGLSGVTTSFHSNYADADSGTNPVLDETNYEFTNGLDEPGFTTMYLRVEDNTTGCASIVPFEIHTNLLLTATDTGDFAICDQNDDNTDTAEFNLLSVENFIANDLPYPITVEFFETEEDRTNGNNIDKNNFFEATSPHTLYISISDGACTQDTEINLRVNPILLFTSPPIAYCDDDDDGIATINLQSLDETITGGNPDFTVSYFRDEVDAENNDSFKRLPQYIANTTPITTLYARIASQGASGCSTVNEIEIEVVTAPSTTQPTDIVICDNDQDGYTVINLNSKISQIISSTSGVDIDFFTSLNDANNKTNEIPEIERNAYNTNTQTIYVRVEDILSSTGCFAIESFEAIVNTLPIFPAISNYQICESSGSKVTDFYLHEKDSEILNGQSGKDVIYFKDSAMSQRIDKHTAFQNTSSPQTIYVRVENISDPSCYGTSSFDLLVSPNPIYDPIVNYLVCADAAEDGHHEINLDEKAQEIKQGSNEPLNISFHKTVADADNNINPLPALYTNTSPFNETIFVRIESEDSLCHLVEPLHITIFARPDLSEALPLETCDEDYDGISNFDLTTADFEIFTRIPSHLISINYFSNFDDINPNDGYDNSNEISNPTNYASNTNTVYIKVTNTFIGCFSVIPLELVVHLPPVINRIGNYPICDNDTDTFELSSINHLLVKVPSEVNISFHSSQSDADNNSSPINNSFNYSANTHTIYVRAAYKVTGCQVTSSFNLIINPNPIANTPPNLMSCDDDFDGHLIFDLSANTLPVIGAQDPTQVTVSYYTTLTDAETKTNSLTTNHLAYDGQSIFARIENNTTGCYSTTQFTTIIYPLPVIPIDDIVTLCRESYPLYIDAFTGDPADTYIWSTSVNASANNATLSEIAVTPSQLGVYSVTVTTPNNCSFTKTFTVIESEQAEITFTSSIDFSDPNSISVDINLNRIGDYVYILDGGSPQKSSTFENVSFGNHTVTVRDLNGCMDETQDVFVFDIPKFFTPNNDSYYDTWHIIGADQLPGSLVHIYNRQGKLLKALHHTSPGWDGMFNGEKMPTDDYWFVANIIQNGNDMVIKGHFTLKR
ncbi:choice-of-anchor L domain-containing protein [Tamlana sp. 2_MG-2023]|uniref:T9SS type B sorting domain-containing protein n=1 Tax=unclassified Tamlana TaxID=2614803 RepID=UPI0026E1B594|nr:MULTISPECIES: T9SS type B sorting domain-containing protein [unclassified Tamlana]MDO6759058.1 choice-of-anchor L domain-containing protein [Tamlana sp. 2_MG-2023]MDO6789757.1 choice-of-anchor L domain-containing protein [Tamlana sp. 1_MG-2023]